MTKSSICFHLLLWLLFWPSPSIGGEPAPPAAANQQREPSIEEVRRAALRHAGLDEHPDRGWARRTRLAGLMPVVTVRISRDLARDEELSRASSGTERLDMGTDEDLGLEARAVWRLDRLIFDDIELRAAQMAQQRHRERLELLTRVTSLYYQRRKLQLKERLDAKAAKDPAHVLAIEELTAQLDVLTGGYFRRALHLPPH